MFGRITGAGGITGEFVDLGAASDRDLAGKSLKGKIALIQRDVAADYPDYWLTDRLIPLGVSGLVFYSRAGHPGGMPTAYYNFKRSLKEPTPPAVDITYEDAAKLTQMHPKRVGLVAMAQVEWHESRNVIGDLTGSATPDEFVLFSAHNDTAYTSPGAADDGGGVAAVMELAQAFASGPRPARTMRFIAWGGHEPGLMGSEAYLRAHTAEINKTLTLINYDGMGSSLGTVGWRATGNKQWLDFLHATLKPLRLEETSSVGPSGTDVTNFASLEIPTITFGQSGGSGGHHTPMDSLEFCSPRGLESGILLAAALGERLGSNSSLTFSREFPSDLLQQVRDYAARWGWGVRPEANLAPKFQK